jgi:hypothetical protein
MPDILCIFIDDSNKKGKPLEVWYRMPKDGIISHNGRQYRLFIEEGTLELRYHHWWHNMFALKLWYFTFRLSRWGTENDIASNGVIGIWEIVQNKDNKTSKDKRKLADNLLSYLKITGRTSWPNTHDIMNEASKVLDAPISDIWKAYELLRILGRIELINPNGRQGMRLLDSTPLMLSGISIEITHYDPTPPLIDILQTLKDKYPVSFDSAIKALK